MNAFEVLLVKFLVGPLKLEKQWSVAFLTWPRSGFRMWWDILEAYKSLQLTSYIGAPSKWAYGAASSWRAFLAKVDSCNKHYIDSRLAKASAKDRGAAGGGPFDWLAASTMGFLCLGPLVGALCATRGFAREARVASCIGVVAWGHPRVLARQAARPQHGSLRGVDTSLA